MESEPCECCLVAGAECITTIASRGDTSLGSTWVLPPGQSGLSDWLSGHSVRLGEEYRDGMAVMTSEEQVGRAHDVTPWMPTPPSSALADDSSNSNDNEATTVAHFCVDMNDRLPPQPTHGKATAHPRSIPSKATLPLPALRSQRAAIQSQPKPMSPAFSHLPSSPRSERRARVVRRCPPPRHIRLPGHTIAARPTARATPSIATVLALLLCYLKPVVVHSELLCQAMASPRSWPLDLHPAGVHMQSHSLRLKVLVRIAEHWLEANGALARPAPSSTGNYILHHNYSASDMRIIADVFEDALNEFAQSPSRRISENWKYRQADIQKTLELGQGERALHLPRPFPAFPLPVVAVHGESRNEPRRTAQIALC
ncbi:Nonribosomal peptide synthetase 14 [Zalerion maritima]|uniref:Nonribosomal peptide synthetase 14 n=1 Tax=Zalerion maritima TaxID=339359 RepID=A0AAD5RK22_9PEZI|nr:Nonribosomal peptide synthetase 14 [Zalerion maritima]